MNDETLDHLQSLDPAFLPLAWAFVSYWRRRGIPLTVISGRRGSALNQEVGGAAQSLHLDGRAIDVSIYWPGYGHLPRSWILFSWWQQLARPWEQAGGRWGGRFNTQDVNHFDSGRPSVEA